MNSTLNRTSLILGIFVGAAAVLTVAATNLNSTQTGTAGRFQLLAADSYLFKIDTETGQVWRTYLTHDLSNFGKPNVVPPSSEPK
jgi:hypothetical protein